MEKYTSYNLPNNKQITKHISILLASIYNFRNKIVWSVVDGTIPELKKDIKKSIKHMNYFEVRYLVELEKKYQKPNNRNSWAYSEYIEIPEINPDDIKNIAESISNRIYEKENEILKKIGKRARLTTVSIGIAPRQTENGSSKSATAWIYIPIDFDVEEWKEKEPTMDEINDKINKILSELPDDYTTPHIIAFTGGGLRFIYYIDRPISRLELPILSKIAEQIGHDADTAMYDIARVDRLPGTKNRKEKYEGGRDCKILYVRKNLAPIAPEVFFYKFGINNEEYKEMVKEASETTESFELINKLKKSNIKIKDFKELTKKEYKFTKFIQAKLTEIYKDSKWIIELFDYLRVGYKSNGKYISIYSIYYNDGNNPDCTIYPNKGYNAIAVDWHNNNLRTNVIAYLWGAYKDKILEFIEKKGISSKVDDYVEAEEYLKELLDKNKNAVIVECEKYLKYEVLQTAIDNSAKENKPVILQAETGRGKTYTITNNIGKIYEENNGKITVLLFPYKSQVMQTYNTLASQGTKVAAYYEGSTTRIHNAKEIRLVIGTYNQLDRIMYDIKYDVIDIGERKEEIQLKEDKDIILIVDEAHNLILQKEFRKKEINNIEQYLNKVYASILLTATPELINLQNKRVVKAVFKDKKEYFKNTFIIESEGRLHNIIDFCKYITMKFNKGSKKGIVLVDSKKDIDTIEEILKLYNFNSEIYKITKETVGTDKAAQMIINSERVPDGLILATRIIAEGINIKNGEGENETIQLNIKDKVDVVAVLKTSSATIIRQFLARVRNGGDTCIIYTEQGKASQMLRYEKMLSMANDDFSLFKEYLVSEYNKEILDIEKELKPTKLIEQLQILKREDGGYKVDEAKIAYLTNRKLERIIVSNSELLKKYLDETTGHGWEIKTIEKIMDEEIGEVLEIRKELSEINKIEVNKLVDIIDERFKDVNNALKYNNYDRFSEYEKYLIVKHIKMARRVVEYIKLHEEFPKITEVILGDDARTQKDIAMKIAELSPAKWGAITKRIKIAYNIVKCAKENLSKMEKGYLKMFETKVLEKIYGLGNGLKNKTITIKEIIMEIQKECGIKLKFEEIKNILSAIYNYISKELKKKRENATIKIIDRDELLERFIKIFKEENKTIEEEIIEKARNGINETELWEYIIEVLKYPEEVYEKTIEKLKNIGELLEPRRGFLISE
ncbi:DEAD/DEAH box helicase family protein [Methanothermococcus sp. Ax23]|uniref:DEAD/DEAH box helicase family protein n=1 Tax=Methanothermococcus sp. Ax23 TaxID=3156486 RepID=UPI003BA3BFFF